MNIQISLDFLGSFVIVFSFLYLIIEINHSDSNSVDVANIIIREIER